jgi:hypothetical protein
MSEVRVLGDRYVRTDTPARLDRLPWARWHWIVVLALGITWVLDGLEVTIVGSLGPRLEQANTLHLTASEVGLTATTYLIGPSSVPSSSASSPTAWDARSGSWSRSAGTRSSPSAPPCRSTSSCSRSSGP